MTASTHPPALAEEKIEVRLNRESIGITAHWRLSGSTLACLALLSSLSYAGTTGQTPPPFGQSAEDVRRLIEERQQALEANARKSGDLQTDLVALASEREKLNAQLLETAALIQKGEGQLTSIEGRIGELEAQEKLVRGSLAQRHDQIAKLLGALQRMGRNPPPVLITRREDALKMVRSAMLLASAFPELKGQALSLGGQLDDLVRVMTNIRSESDRLQKETTRLNEMKTRLAGLMEARKVTLADRQSELQTVQAASAEITRSVGDLSELIAKLDKTVTEKTGLGAYQRELAQKPAVVEGAQSSAATAVVAAVPVSPASPVTAVPAPPLALEPSAASPLDATTGPEMRVAALGPPPQLKPRVIELAPSGGGLLPGTPGRIRPALPFSSARAKLPMPAQGRRTLAFGERTQFGGASKGILIETRTNGQVTAPCDGWIVFAGEFRSYGQLLIINAGDGYHVLLAGMTQIDVQPGQFVLAAEPVGSMGGQFQKASAANRINAPLLYVEFRKDGRPIDPDPWWVAGQQKVQG